MRPVTCSLSLSLCPSLSVSLSLPLSLSHSLTLFRTLSHTLSLPVSFSLSRTHTHTHTHTHTQYRCSYYQASCQRVCCRGWAAAASAGSKRSASPPRTGMNVRRPHTRRMMALLKCRLQGDIDVGFCERLLSTKTFLRGAVHVGTCL